MHNVARIIDKKSPVFVLYIENENEKLGFEPIMTAKDYQEIFKAFHKHPERTKRKLIIVDDIDKSTKLDEFRRHYTTKLKLAKHFSRIGGGLFRDQISRIESIIANINEM